MLKRIITALSLCLLTAPLAAMEGMKVFPSNHELEETTERLVSVLEEKGMNVFERIDHAAGARAAGLELKPTTLVLFDNPEVGTQLMQCNRSVAIDLPMKALIWEDDSGVWLAFNDPAYLEARHDLGECSEVLATVERAVNGFAEAATGR